MKCCQSGQRHGRLTLGPFQMSFSHTGEARSHGLTSASTLGHKAPSRSRKAFHCFIHALFLFLKACKEPGLKNGPLSKIIA